MRRPHPPPRDAGVVVPDAVEVPAAPDDVLDAAVVAWTAARIGAGVACSLPDPPQVDEEGHPLAIWY